MIIISITIIIITGVCEVSQWINDERRPQPRLERRPTFIRGNWSVTIGGSPLLKHGYNQTDSRHYALNKAITRY